jgi:hypothetical protein
LKKRLRKKNKLHEQVETRTVIATRLEEIVEILTYSEQRQKNDSYPKRSSNRNNTCEHFFNLQIFEGKFSQILFENGERKVF